MTNYTDLSRSQSRESASEMNGHHQTQFWAIAILLLHIFLPSAFLAEYKCEGYVEDD